VLSSTANGQLQSQHEYKHSNNMTTEDKTNKTKEKTETKKNGSV
jgi:hypothetical protein